MFIHIINASIARYQLADNDIRYYILIYNYDLYNNVHN